MLDEPCGQMNYIQQERISICQMTNKQNVLKYKATMDSLAKILVFNLIS